MNIEQLKEEEADLVKKIDANRELQREYYKNEFVQKYGVDVGDIALLGTVSGEIKSFRHSSRHTISSIDYAMLKKDGSVGQRMGRFYAINSIKLISKAK